MSLKESKSLSRRECTRERRHVKVVKFDLDETMGHFAESVESIRALFSTAERMLADGKTEEAKNIWRSQIVLLASAFDFYMHELTKFGLCEIYEGRWSETPAYDRLSVSMDRVETALATGGDPSWFLDYVSDHDRSTSMISFRKVSEQMSLLGLDIKMASQRAYPNCSKAAASERLEHDLAALGERRNTIVHQTDRTRENAEVADIDPGISERFISDVTRIVEALDSVAREKGTKNIQ